MRRVLTTVLAVALLLGLGALAVLALPGGGAPLAGAPAVSAAAPEFQDAPEAVLATNKFNMIAMPLNSQNQFTSASQTFDAKGLAGLVGTGVVQTLSWDPAAQQYLTWNTDFGGYGTNFPLNVGGAYWLVLDSNASNIVSFVGDVPAANSVKFNFVSGANCQFNEFSLPLEQSGITNAQQLAAAISTGVVQVIQWNATTQEFETWNTDFGGYGTNFATKIGYPYLACLSTGAPSVWP